MSTSGILNPDSVIFYHPLDDVVELTQNIGWSGDAFFVPGEVGNAASPIVSSDITIGPTQVIQSGSSVQENSPISITSLTNDKAVIAYSSNAPSGDETGKVRVGIRDGLVMVWGDEYVYNTENDVAKNRQNDISALDDNRFIIGYSHNTGTLGSYARVGSVSGMTVTFGNEFQFNSSVIFGELRTEAIDSSHAILFYRDPTDNKPYGLICTILGTDITFGTPSKYSTVTQPVNIFSDRTMTIAVLTPSSVIAITSEERPGNGENMSKVGIIGGLSGTDIAWGSGVDPGETALQQIDVAVIDSETVILCKTGVDAGDALVGTISDGSGISWGEETQYAPGDIQEAVSVSLGLNNILIFHRNTASSAGTVLGTINGTVLDFGTPVDLPNLKTHILDISKFNTAGFTMVGIDQDVTGDIEGTVFSWIGLLDAFASLSGLIGDSSYPSISGATRLTCASWSNNLTHNFSVVIIERGYNISINKDHISLGSGTAVWNDFGILSLLDDMNDDTSHFLILDFEYVSGGTWLLNTSFDGESFVDRGTQQSGSQNILTTDTDPRLIIESGLGPAQWIDELVLWAGDKDVLPRFRDFQLSTLYGLGQSGLMMNQYPEFIISQSIDLFIYGPLPLSESMHFYTEGPLPHNDNMNLFIKGPSSESDGTTLRTINRFTKTSAHDPQLIGTFTILASGVNIEVWDIVDGQNTLLALSSSGCYQIGNTDRWSWSTAGLPLSGKKKYHYYYRMTSNVAEEQLGEFFLTVPEGGRWSYPDNFGTYLVS